MTGVITDSQRAILISYRDQKLAIPLYGGAKREAYYSEDFLEASSLAYIMNEIFDCESDITEVGIRFLREFFGLEKLAHLLAHKPEFDESSSDQETLKLLEGMVANSIGDFIREARAKSDEH